MIPTLALELAPRRIRVNAVSPGFTDTPMMRTTPGMGSDEVAAMLAATAAKNPFGRVGRPEDIAETVAFLASDGAVHHRARDRGVRRRWIGRLTELSTIDGHISVRTRCHGPRA